jgi:hypothetical protein
MRSEEGEVMRAFRATNTADASTLLEERDALRRALEALGVRVELHAAAAACARRVSLRASRARRRKRCSHDG